MQKIIHNNLVYSPYEYDSEAEFEKDVIDFSDKIFGKDSIYLDVKKKISNNNIATIPDGYLIDFSFINNPQLYLIENELSVHDPYRHIGQQLLKFAVSYKSAGREIKTFLMDEIIKDKAKEDKLMLYIKKINHRNIDYFLESLIFNKKPSIIVVIDEKSDDLSNVLNQLTISTDILEFRKFINQQDSDDIIYQYSPFQDDLTIKSVTSKGTFEEKSISADILAKLDTIVIPANEDGFNQVFLNENRWWKVRISSPMLDKIKYIAAYQTSPVSAITYIAEVDKIEKYPDSDKYVLYFKSVAQKIGPIKLVPKSKIRALQGPRYTSFELLQKAKNLDEAFFS